MPACCSRWSRWAFPPSFKATAGAAPRSSASCWCWPATCWCCTDGGRRRRCRRLNLTYEKGYAHLGTGSHRRLGRLLVNLMPEPEVLGLLALMLLRESRRPARTSAGGERRRVGCNAGLGGALRDGAYSPACSSCCATRRDTISTGLPSGSMTHAARSDERKSCGALTPGTPFSISSA
jgi:hypothetical protein